MITAERVADLAEGFAVGQAVVVGADLQDYREPGMAEDELSIAGRDLQVLELDGGFRQSSTGRISDTQS